MHLAHPSSFTEEIVEVLQAIVGVIDMSNPEHETFADSGADCLDELLRHDERIRASLARRSPRNQRPKAVTPPRGSSWSASTTVPGAPPRPANRRKRTRDRS